MFNFKMFFLTLYYLYNKYKYIYGFIIAVIIIIKKTKHFPLPD